MNVRLSWEGSGPFDCVFFHNVFGVPLFMGARRNLSPSWLHLRANLRLVGKLLGSNLGPSWAKLAPSWASMGVWCDYWRISWPIQWVLHITSIFGMILDRFCNFGGRLEPCKSCSRVGSLHILRMFSSSRSILIFDRFWVLRNPLKMLSSWAKLAQVGPKLAQLRLKLGQLSFSNASFDVQGYKTWFPCALWAQTGLI